MHYLRCVCTQACTHIRTQIRTQACTHVRSFAHWCGCKYPFNFSYLWNRTFYFYAQIKPIPKREKIYEFIIILRTTPTPPPQQQRRVVFRCSLCISIRGSVRPSVFPWSVRLAFFFKSRKSRGNDIESLENKIWQIWLINLTNLTNLSDKSILVPNFRRIFVRTNLFFLTIGRS